MIDNVCQNVNNNVLPLEGIVQDCQNDEDGVHAGQSDEELVEGVVHVRLRQDDDAQDVADQTHDRAFGHAAKREQQPRQSREVPELGLRAEQVLFVGDSPEHDIAGAAALGMRTALIIDEGMPPPLQSGKQAIDAHHTIRSLAELPALVRG